MSSMYIVAMCVIVFVKILSDVIKDNDDDETARTIPNSSYIYLDKIF